MRVTRAIFGLVVALGLFVISVSNVGAIDNSGTGVQGYASSTPIENGTIVELTGDKSDQVKVATQTNLRNMFGVAIDRNVLPVTLTGGSLKNETFVAVSGVHTVLVSTQGGAIQKGDYVTLSSINGVAMKAGTEESTVFGRANSTFDGKGITLGTTTLKDTDGKDNKIVKLGSIPVTIDIRNNPNDKSTEVDIIEQLKRVGEQVAEKEVSPIRIYLSMAITFVSIIAAIIILYSGVRNSVISIGRNPMSKKSIFRALLEIVLTTLLILIIGLFAVYLLLKL